MCIFIVWCINIYPITQKIRWVYRNENTHHTEGNETGKNRNLNGIGIPQTMVLVM